MGGWETRVWSQRQEGLFQQAKQLQACEKDLIEELKAIIKYIFNKHLYLELDETNTELQACEKYRDLRATIARLARKIEAPSQHLSDKLQTCEKELKATIASQRGT